MNPLVIALLLAVGLSACDDKKTRAAMAQTAENDAELRQLTDPAHGPELLRRRLLQQLTVSGEFLAVKPYVSTIDVQVIPTNTPWTVRCDRFSGLILAFTPNVVDDSGGLMVRLSEASPDKEQCVTLVLSTAKTLKAVLN